MTAVEARTSGRLPGTYIVLADAEILARHVAAWLLNRVLGAPGRIAVCVAGGDTPRPAYALLAQSPYRDCFPWDRVHWFWGDERCVPPDHPRSNFRMVRETLLDRVPVLPAHIHPIPAADGPVRAAAAYADELERFYGAATLAPERPLFAATLLGIGTNGHTASLFPGTAALREMARWVAAVPEATPEPRVTLTYPALDSSGALAFLASGAAKRPVLERLARGDDLPAAHIHPVGRLTWFVDQAAAP
ncbi:MAG: 6-phosphogluconolactonase [Alphaproteobacteria bacterium]|nr:6-phosphogluconolactonase [Alphaproteobacteria bacterium]